MKNIKFSKNHLTNNLKYYWYNGGSRTNYRFKNKFKMIISMILKMLFVHYDYTITGNNISNNIFFICHERKDYRSLFNKITQNCDGIKYFVNSKKGYIPYLNRIILLLRCFGETKYTDIPICDDFEKVIGKKTIKNNFSERISLSALYVINYLSIMNIFISPKHKNLCVLCDAWPAENILIDIAKTYGLITISCQHAIYFKDSKLKNSNMAVLEDLPSDVYLVWGLSTKELLKKDNPDKKYIICGNPLFENKQDKRISYNKNIWAVMGDIPENHIYTQKLINISVEAAHKYDVKIKIRLHPLDRSNAETYQIDNDYCSFDASTDDAEVILVHVTTMTFDYILKGHRVYKLRSDAKCPEINDCICFSNFIELSNLIEKKYESSANIVSNQIFATGRESQKLYEQYFVEN